MDLLMRTSTLLGVLALVALLWLIHVYRKNIALKQAALITHENSLQLALLQERYDQISRQEQEKQTLLAHANEQLQLTNAELAALKQSINDKNELLGKYEQQKNALEQQLEQLRQQNGQQNSTITKLQTEFEQEQKTSAEKLAFLDEAKTKLSNEFKVLANQIFDAKQGQMTESGKIALDSIIKPMQKDMSEFRARIEQVHKDDTEARISLAHHLKDLKTLNQQMSQDALNLTLALKGDSKAQGNWGEMILEKLLESSGLREGYEFEREKSFANDEGKRQRPDVIINMPGDKQVIIDAKVSLTDYERAISSQDDIVKQQFIRAHVKSMQQHIQTLASKRYDHLEGVHSPDYVLMFMPIEGAYLMAIEADSSIFESAFDKRIAVVTPSTLYATLKLIEQLWRYERQSENVAKLTKQAGNLHDKFVVFIKSFEDIEIHLSRAKKSYDSALGQLRDGRGNLVNQVKTLADLSGKAKKEIPAHLLGELPDESSQENLPLSNS